jgi:hypothetical protein
MARKTLFKTIAAAVLATGLSACGTAQMNMIEVQTATAKTLGLASSDEITITDVKYGTKNALGGTPTSYVATTGKGRRFACSVFMIPGLTPLDKPTYSDWKCQQVK